MRDEFIRFYWQSMQVPLTHRHAITGNLEDNYTIHICKSPLTLSCFFQSSIPTKPRWLLQVLFHNICTKSMLWIRKQWKGSPTLIARQDSSTQVLLDKYQSLRIAFSPGPLRFGFKRFHLCKLKISSNGNQMIKTSSLIFTTKIWKRPFLQT
jgi:hypothetical protein